MVAAVSALAAVQSLAGAPPPAKAFVFGNEMEFAALSPDGRYVAIRRELDSGSKIVVFEPRQTQPESRGRGPHALTGAISKLCFALRHDSPFGEA